MLVGRDHERRQLTALLDGVVGGTARAMLVVGEPGMGKSALVGATADEARERGIRVVTVTAVENEQAIPYAVGDLLLAQLGTGATASDTASLLRAIGEASEAGPLLVVVDDLHWVDDETRRALTFAVRRLLADPVAVLLASRPSSAVEAELSGVERLDLEPLAPDDAAALLRRTNPSVDPATARAVALSLGALPLALVESAALLPAHGVSGPLPVPVGQAVVDRYAAGVERLDPTSRLAVTVLAASDGGEPSLLGVALGEAGLSLGSLEAAEADGLVELGLAPRFVHPLARSATYTAATPALRRTAHTAWAQAAAAAGQRSRALRHRIAAAVGPDEELATEVEAEVSRLVAVNARAEAISLAETAVALSVDADARRRRLLALVECVPVPPRMMEAVAELERSGASNDVRARCAVALSYWHGEDDLHAMVEALVSGLDTAALDQELRARIELARIANALDLVDLNRLAVAVDDVESAALRHLWPLAALGQGCTVLGQHRRATGHLRAAAEVASATPVEQLGFPELVYWTASLRQLGDRPEEHRAALQTFSRFVDRGDDPSHRMHYAFVAADRARVDGQWSRAVAGYAEAYDLESAVFGMPTSRTAWVWARTQAHRGDLDDARRLVEVGRRTQSFEAPGLDDVWGDHVEGLVAQLGGAPRAAVAAFSRAAHTAPVTHGAQGPRAASAVELVELLVSLGERERAAEELARIDAALDGIVDRVGLGLLARCRALVGTADPAEAFDEAIALHDQAEDPFEAARTRLLQGEHLRRSGRPRDARPLLEESFAAFRAVGAAPWAARAGEELRASGVTVDAPAASTDLLTPSELRVALAVSDGMTNAEAAAALFLSVKTVEFHLGRAFRKLGVRSRTQLRREMEKQGLLVAP
ncbi:MAG: AAA family ATPase [Candidatus Nanopelagicales bacterium]